MTVRKGSIVVHSDSEGWEETNFRVEDVDGHTATVRSLVDYMVAKEDVGNLVVRYQTDTFDTGDIVRVRREYAGQYNEADGGNELTVVAQFTPRGVPTTHVENNCGERFNILNERIHLVRPGKSFKAGDRVIVDLDLAKKYDNDGIPAYWRDIGPLVLTEDSGSRAVQTTSHVRFENDESNTNNVPTRWLKLYEEPAKRVVGETIKVEDVKVGDTIRATYTAGGLIVTLEGKVGSNVSYNGGEHVVTVDGGGAFPKSALNPVFILVEEAPEPVDENLQRLLDAEVGDVAYGTYANEYWKKTGDDEWQMIDGCRMFRTTNQLFESFYKLKYGTLEIYRKVEDAN